MVKVSVVVPVYNQEEYLRRCMDSILAQSLREIEVIPVDDGSTDSSLSILREYEAQDERVHVLTQQNSYAGIARNNGLKAAQGEYVIFWDSDDYFSEDGLWALYEEARRQEADICVGEAVKEDLREGLVKSQTHYIHTKYLPEKRPFSVEDIPQYIFNFSNNVPWNKLYRRQFLEETGLKFQGTKRSNDTYLVMMAFALASRITVTDRVIVYYQFRNEGSLSNRALKNSSYVMEAFEKVKEELKVRGLWANEAIRQSYVNKAYSTVSTQFAIIEERDEFKELFDYYKNDVLPRLEIGRQDVELMYSDKHAYELAHLLAENDEQFLFSMYLFHRGWAGRIGDKNARLASRNEDMNDKNAQLKETVSALREKNEAVSGRNAQLKGIVGALREKNEHLQARNAVVSDRNVKLKEKVGALQERNGRLQSRNEEVISRNQELKEKVGTLREKGERKDTRIAAQKEKIDSLKAHSERQGERIEHLKESTRQKSETIRDQRARLKEQEVLLSHRLMRFAAKADRLFHRGE